MVVGVVLFGRWWFVGGWRVLIRSIRLTSPNSYHSISLSATHPPVHPLARSPQRLLATRRYENAMLVVLLFFLVVLLLARQLQDVQNPPLPGAAAQAQPAAAPQ
jgi:hypothetical protein